MVMWPDDYGRLLLKVLRDCCLTQFRSIVFYFVCALHNTLFYFICISFRFATGNISKVQRCVFYGLFAKNKRPVTIHVTDK